MSATSYSRCFICYLASAEQPRTFDIIVVIIWMQSITKSIEINSFEYISLEYSRFSQTITPTHFLSREIRFFFSWSNCVHWAKVSSQQWLGFLFPYVCATCIMHFILWVWPVCFLTSRRIDANSSQFVHT